MSGYQFVRLANTRRVLLDAGKPITALRCGLALNLPDPRRAVHLLRTLEARGQAERCGHAPNGHALWRGRDATTTGEDGNDGNTPSN